MMVSAGKQPETMDASGPELMPLSPHRFQRLRFCKVGSPSVKTVIDLTDDNDDIGEGCSYAKIPKNNIVVEHGIAARGGRRPAVACKEPKGAMQVSKRAISDLGKESDILEFLTCMGSNVLHNIMFGKPKRASDVPSVGLEHDPIIIDQCEEPNAYNVPDSTKIGWDDLKDKMDCCESGWEQSNEDAHYNEQVSANKTDTIKDGWDDLNQTEKNSNCCGNGWGGSANEDLNAANPITEIASDPWGDEVKKKFPSTSGWDIPSEEQNKATTQEEKKELPWSTANEADPSGVACDMLNQESDVQYFCSAGMDHSASGMQIDIAIKESNKNGWGDEDGINSSVKQGWGSSTNASKVMQKGTPGMAEVDINPDEDKKQSGRYAPSGANLVPLGERKMRREEVGKAHEDQIMVQLSEDQSNPESSNVNCHASMNTVHDADNVLDESVCGVKSTKEDDIGWASVPGPSKDNQSTVFNSKASPKQSIHEVQPWGEIKKVVTTMRRILRYSGYKSGDRLGPEDQEEVLNIITHHPSKDSKIGCGVDYIMIDTHPDHQVECFFIVRTDETRSDISFRKCIKGMIQAKYPAHEKEILDYCRFV